MAGPPRKLSVEDPFTEESRPIGTAILGPAPSGGDDYAALHAATLSVQASGLRLVLQPGTYQLFANPFTVAAGSKPIDVVGIPPTDIGGPWVGTTLKAMASMRAVIDVLSAYSTFTNLIVDANGLATYGVYFQSATITSFTRVWEKNALLDGFHSFSTGINQGIKLSQCRGMFNGKTYATAGILAQYPNNSVRQLVAAGTAATTAGNDTIVLSGGPDLTTLPIRTGFNGDMIRVGSNSQTAFYGQILAVTSNTVTLQASTNGWPTKTLAGQEYAIGIGFGWYQRSSADNGFCTLADGSIFRSNGCGGIFENALYGDTLVNCLVDYNNMCGTALGLISNATLCNGVVAQQLYSENNIGPDFVIGSVRDAEIHAPQGGSILSTGLFKIGGGVISSTWILTRGGAVETQDGLEQNFLVEFRNVLGTIQHRVVSEHWSGNAALQAGRIVGAATAWTNTPTLNSGTDFAAGVGVYDAGGVLEILLNTANAQSASVTPDCTLEFNSTGTAYTPSSTVVSINVNGTTQARCAIFITDSGGTLHSVSAATMADGQSIGIRVKGPFK